MIGLPSLITSQPPSLFTHQLPLFSPMSGRILPLGNIQDDALNAGVWGSGVALLVRSTVCSAPIDGVIESIDIPSQRWIIKAKSGLRLMIQIGVLKQSLFGERLQPQIQAKSACKAGEILTYLDPIWLKSKLGELHCIVTVLNHKGVCAIVPAKDNTAVEAMDDLMQVYLNVNSTR